jgi:uncharacterized protein YcgL (UPF0745 family)
LSKYVVYDSFTNLIGIVPDGISKTFGNPQNAIWLTKRGWKLLESGAVKGVTGVIKMSIPVFAQVAKNSFLADSFSSQAV